MNKCSSLLALLLLTLACTPSLAADLGQARLRSQRGEPLVVDVPLVLEGKDEIESLAIVATGSDTASGGGHIPLAHELRRLDNGRYVVRLSSGDPVAATKLGLWVMAESIHGKASRNFQLSLRAGPRASTAQAAKIVPPAGREDATTIAPAPRVTAASLAAMNASLDEEARRIRAIVARQRETMLAQVTQIETQRRQLEQIGGKSKLAAEATAAAQARLAERGESLRGLQHDIDAVVGTPGAQPMAVADDASPVEQERSAASVSLAHEAHAPPVAVNESASPAPTQATPADTTRDSLALAPARGSAAPGRRSPIGSTDSLLWWGIGGLTAVLAGSVYVHRRKRLAASDPRDGNVLMDKKQPDAIGHQPTDAAFTRGASFRVPFGGRQRTWAEASGLTENLIHSMRNTL